MNINVVSPRSMDVVFKMIDLVIVAQLVTHFLSISVGSASVVG